jgi:EmrB/QacA subfamily drug resistance transporter
LGLRVPIGPSRTIAANHRYKWWVYVAVATGLIVTVMDQSGVGIAMPRIADHFGADIPTVQWITLGYVLTTSAFLLPMGRVSDLVGRERVYLAGLVFFMVLASIAGTSQVLPMLLAAKALQGIGAAAIQSNAMAMVVGAFPEEERGRAVGFYMTIIGTGSIGGPIIGGLLVSGLGWRSVFFAAIPAGLVALLVGLSVLKRSKPPVRDGRGGIGFDWVGAVLSSAALTTFLLSMTSAHRLGWTSPQIVIGFGVAVLLFVVFVRWERRTQDPMLDLGLFQSRLFSMGFSARFLSFLGMSASFFLMPFYLIQILEYPASQAGLLMVPGSILLAITGPMAGRLSDRIGTRWLAVVGLAFSATAMMIFSRLSPDSPPIHVILGMVLSGTGSGMFSAANTSAIMSSLGREKYGIVAALLSVTRTTASVTGVATATTIIAITMADAGFAPSLGEIAEEGGQGIVLAFTSGMGRAFIVATGLVLGALLLSILRGESNLAQSDKETS